MYELPRVIEIERNGHLVNRPAHAYPRAHRSFHEAAHKLERS